MTAIFPSSSVSYDLGNFGLDSAELRLPAWQEDHTSLPENKYFTWINKKTLLKRTLRFVERRSWILFDIYITKLQFVANDLVA